MKTNTLKAKLLNCFFAFTLVFGLCIPSIGTYAYAEPTDGIANDTVAAHVEGSDTQGENQANDVGGDNGLAPVLAMAPVLVTPIILVMGIKITLTPTMPMATTPTTTAQKQK